MRLLKFRLTESRFMRLSWILLILMTLLSGQFIYHQFFDSSATDARPGRDFLTFYAAGWMALKGQAVSSYNFASLHAIEQQFVPGASAFAWYYPPTALLFNAPLTWLNHTAAYLAFMTASLGIYGLGCWRNWPDKRTLFAVFGFTGVTVNIVFGQNGLLTAGLFLLAWADLPQRPVRAGIWLALLALKPHLFCLWLPLLVLTKQWRTLVSFTLFSGYFLMLSLWAFGLEAWLAWWHTIAQAQTNLALGKLPWDKMISIYAHWRLLGLSTTWGYVGQALIALSALLLCIDIWRHTQQRALQGSAVALTTLCISPYLYDYELAWLSITLLLLCQRGLTMGFYCGEKLLYFTLWLYPVIDMLVLDSIKPSLSPVIIVSLLLWVRYLAHQADTISYYSVTRCGYSLGSRKS